MTINAVIAMIFMVIAVIQDYKYYKIRNIAIIIFSVSGIFIAFLHIGDVGILSSILGLFIPLVLYPLFCMRMLGAGDIKALSALGAIMGLSAIVYIMIYSIIAGGIIALIFLIIRRNGVERVKRLFMYIKMIFIMKKIIKYDNFNSKDSVFRFSYAIIAGLIIYLIIGKF